MQGIRDRASRRGVARIGALSAAGRRRRTAAARRTELDEALRREGDALVELADARRRGPRRASRLRRSNGATISSRRSPAPSCPSRSRSAAPELSSRRGAAVRPGRGERREPEPRPAQHAVCLRNDLSRSGSRPARGSRSASPGGSPVPPGSYRVVVVAAGGARKTRRPVHRPARRAGVLLQDLEVPDFWTGELATSTVMLADRVEQLAAADPGRTSSTRTPMWWESNRIHVTRAAGLRPGAGADRGVSDL